MKLKELILIEIGLLFAVLCRCRSNGDICRDDVTEFEGSFKMHHRVVLDPGGRYVVQWEVDAISDTVKFTVEIETLGYIGLGFSKNGKKNGADIVIGRPFGTDYIVRVFSNIFALIYTINLFLVYEILRHC